MREEGKGGKGKGGSGGGGKGEESLEPEKGEGEVKFLDSFLACETLST